MAKQQTQGAKDSPRVDVQEVAQRSMEVSIQIEKVHWTKCNFFKIQPTKRPPSLKVRGTPTAGMSNVVRNMFFY